MNDVVYQTELIDIVRYSDQYEKIWDDFVLGESVNGTILQTRNFLNYHRAGKFDDSSLLFYHKNVLIAVCPAARIYDNDLGVFLSHPGSTYGGIVFSKNVLRTQKILNLIDSLETYLKSEGYRKIVLKQTNPLMCSVNQDLLEFCLYFRKYIEYKELDLFIDFNTLDDDIISSFSKLKKRNVKKCLDNGLELRKVDSEIEMKRFIEILTINLEKYGLKPYHTVSDIQDLLRRFPNDIELWGAYFNGKMIAASMVFLIHSTKCAHTHYLAADLEYNNISPMSFIYYKMIELYKKIGYRFLSWGITSEHYGLEINENLTNTKEEFGSKHNVVSVYEKYL